MVLPQNNYDDDTRIDPMLDHPCIGCKYKDDAINCLKEYGCGLKDKKV
jgi:hypothetical protein